MKVFANSIDIPLVETSAKTGEQIETVFRTIAENMLSTRDKTGNNGSNVRVESNVIDLNDSNDNVKKKRSCC